MIVQTVNNQIDHWPHREDCYHASGAPAWTSCCFLLQKNTGRELCRRAFMQNRSEFYGTWQNVGLEERLAISTIKKISSQPNAQRAIICSVGFDIESYAALANCLRSEPRFSRVWSLHTCWSTWRMAGMPMKVSVLYVLLSVWALPCPPRVIKCWDPDTASPKRSQKFWHLKLYIKECSWGLTAWLSW